MRRPNEMIDTWLHLEEHLQKHFPLSPGDNRTRDALCAQIFLGDSRHIPYPRLSQKSNKLILTWKSSTNTNSDGSESLKFCSLGDVPNFKKRKPKILRFKGCSQFFGPHCTYGFYRTWSVSQTFSLSCDLHQKTSHKNTDYTIKYGWDNDL